MQSLNLCDIEYIESNRNEAIIRYDGNATENMSTVTNQTLTLSFKTSSYHFLDFAVRDDIKVRIYSSQINKLDFKGGSNFSSKDTLRGDVVDIVNKGIGDIEVKTKSQTLKIVNKGAGSLYLDATSGYANIINAGVGDLSMSLLVDSLEVTNSGAGSLGLKGNARFTSLRNSGVGDADLDEFQINHCIINNKGAGSVFVNAQDSLSITNNGVGGVSYNGNPEVYFIESKGMGQVTNK
ncbi:MAG: GIN domain-containing protein [Bacteroidia bacterium]